MCFDLVYVSGLVRQIFPRFYFVSNVALLDMLANGTNPPKIMPYLGDCYDSLANLTFVTLEDGSTSSKTVNEMVREKHNVYTFRVCCVLQDRRACRSR